MLEDRQRFNEDNEKSTYRENKNGFMKGMWLFL